MGNRWLATAGIAAVALVAAACGSTSAGGSGGSAGSGGSGGGSGAGTAATSSSTVKETSMGGAKVLTTSKGFTIYWFAIDSKGKSKCYGSCAHYWPIVKGPVSASGVSGTFGTITRTDGTKQATWNGHPLYTYIGDTAPGDAKGNNLNINGGIWKEVVVSGTAPAPAPSKSKSSGGGGYGY